MVTYNKSLISYIKYVYDKVQKDREYEVISLFEIDNNKLEIKNIDALMYRYFMEYCKANSLKLLVKGNRAAISNIIVKAIFDAKKYYADVKILEQSNLNFILEEIGWIKACRYLNVEEYQNADRIGRMSNQIVEGPQKLQKNSKTRSAIFKVMELYDSGMRANNKVDFNDVSIFALEQVRKKPIKKYTHIICDESQDLTRVQLEFINELINDKNYSSTLFVSDNAQSIYPQSWMVKGRSFTSVGFYVKGRSNSLAKNYRTTTQIAEAAYSLLEKDLLIIEDENYVKPSLLDKQGMYPVFKAFENKAQEASYACNLISKLSKDYNYGDIAVIARTNGQIKEFSTYLEAANIPFKLMTSQDGYEFGDDKVKILTMHSIKGLEFKVVIMIGLNSKSIPLKSNAMDDEGSSETRERKLMYVGMTRATERLSDMKKLQVFSGIAAGDPILLNSTTDEEFYIPELWLQRNTVNYMVRVKGDSMINANINDGDLVVIRKQNTANNYEIVAVDLDGNTTLKRFVKMGDTVLLMPENSSYEPINVTETQMSILGVAVGVVKNINT